MVSIGSQSVVVYAVGGLLLLVLLIAFFARRANRRRRELLNPLFESGTARTTGLFGSSIFGYFVGYQCRYSVHPRSNNNPGGATLVIPVASPQEWTVTVAGTGSRLMVRVGVLKDFEIGEPDLDESLRFAAAEASIPATVFADGRSREALRCLVATEHFRSVKLRTSRISVHWVPFDRSLEKDVDAVRERFKHSTNLIRTVGLPPG